MCAAAPSSPHQACFFFFFTLVTSPRRASGVSLLSLIQDGVCNETYCDASPRWTCAAAPSPLHQVHHFCRRLRSNPSGKCSQERLARGTVTSTTRRAAHPSGCVRCASAQSPPGQVCHCYLKCKAGFVPDMLRFISRMKFVVRRGSIATASSALLLQVSGESWHGAQ